MQYVRTEKTPGGNLRLILLPEAREDLLELKRRMDDPAENFSTLDAEAEVLEHLIGNGFQYIEPKDVGALTDAPMISDDLEPNADDTGFQVTIGGSVYAFMLYESRSILDELAEKGAALFTGAKVEK